MKIEPDFATLSFASAESGSLLIAAVEAQGRHVVCGMKARFDLGGSGGGGGAAKDFLVTLGPFVAEHGHRPVVYPPDHLADLAVLDVTGHWRLTPSLAPQDLEPRPEELEDVLGTLLFLEERTLMRVGNFGRAGPEQVTGLDPATGELVALPDHDAYLTGRRWTLVGPGPGDAFEFAVEGSGG